MPQLYTRIMWAFHLPVGSATASPPISAPLSMHRAPSPLRCSLLLSGTWRPGTALHASLADQHRSW